MIIGKIKTKLACFYYSQKVVEPIMGDIIQSDDIYEVLIISREVFFII